VIDGAPEFVVELTPFWRTVKMETKYLGSTLALAVAGFIASASLSATAGDTPAATMTVRCVGINSCKGTGSCSTASNGCKGTNSCKGKGVTMVSTEKECTDKKGTIAMAAATTTTTTTTTTTPAAPTPPATPPTTK
jgi:hypothetical protein